MISSHLTLGALQVAGDAGVFGPVQHGADLLTQFQSGGSDETRRLPPDPDEDVGPAVEDVHALRVQQGLQLRNEMGRSRGEGGEDGGLVNLMKMDLIKMILFR